LLIFAVTAGLTLGGIALAITALPIFIILYGVMLPTIVAFLVDNQPGRYLFCTVGVTNLAGVVPFLRDSLHYGLNAGMIVSPVGSIETWLTIYGAAVGGWLMAIGVPMLWQLAFELVLNVRMRRYQAAREARPRNGISMRSAPNATPVSRGGKTFPRCHGTRRAVRWR